MEDTLQIATFNGAKALGIDQQIGSIEPGKKADVILFEQNPFENPKHLLAGKMIIKGGKLYKQQ